MYKSKVDKILFSDVYSDGLFKPGTKSYVKDKQRFEHALKVLNYPKQKIIYEIGPYPGTSAYYFGEDNFIVGIGKNDNIFGDRFKACGHEICDMDFELDDIPASMINGGDIVTVMEVIEHIRQPFQFLSKVARLVKPGGEIYLTTNNMSYLGYILKLIGGKSPLDNISSESSFYPGHCRYYNEYELAEVLTALGFKIYFARKTNFLPSYSLYVNEKFGFLKNSIIKIAPERYSSHIEILAFKPL
jgi:SAM-dependent methyltransferase